MQGNQQIKGRWRRKPTQKLPFEAPHLLRNGPWSIRMRPPVLPYSLSSPAPLSEIRTGLSWCHELCSVSRLWWYGAKSSVLGSRVLLRHRVLVHTCLWPQSRAAMDSRYVHSPLQWQSELRAPAPGGELARPSTGVHRMGMLREVPWSVFRNHFDSYFDPSLCLSPFPLICIYPDHPVHVNEKWGQGIAKDWSPQLLVPTVSCWVTSYFHLQMPYRTSINFCYFPQLSGTKGTSFPTKLEN